MMKSVLAAILCALVGCERGTGTPTYSGRVTAVEKGSSGGIGTAETMYVTLEGGVRIRVGVNGCRRIPGVGDHLSYWVDNWNGDWWSLK